MKNPLNIVIVDDTSFNLDLLEILLSQLNLQATRFTSPTLALAYIKENPTDLLLTDYNMPEVNGLELIQEAKLHRPQLRSALITALRDEHGTLKNEALSNGAHYFLTYPINFHDFQNCMKVLSQSDQHALYCQKENTMCINRDKVLTQGSVMCCRDEIDEERDVIIDVIDAIEDCHNNASTVMRCSSKLSYLSDILNANDDIELRESLPEIKRFSYLIYDFSQKIQEDPEIRALAMTFSNGLKDWFSHKFIKANTFYNISNFTQSLKADLSTLEMALGVCCLDNHHQDLDDLFF